MPVTSVLMAGFGGQGVLLAGEVLAHAAVAEGREASWLPSYGPEMRGGTANVTVCIAEGPIASPLVTSPDALLAMNGPSLDRFGPRVQPGGLLVVDTSLVDRDPGREDCAVIGIDARALAIRSGSERAANFAMLGACVGASAVVAPSSVEAEIERRFGSRAALVAANLAAFRAGLEEGRRAPAGAGAGSGR